MPPGLRVAYFLRTNGHPRDILRSRFYITLIQFTALRCTGSANDRWSVFSPNFTGELKLRPLGYERAEHL